MSRVAIPVVGIDLAMANMGLASGLLVPQDGGGWGVECLDLELVSTKGEDRKVVRKSSQDLRRAQELSVAMRNFCHGHVFAFVEVPSGSQSAAGAKAVGLAIGVLAGCPIPIIEVSQQEVKEAVTGKRKGAQASKAEIIEWAGAQWPGAPWRRAQHKAKLPDKRLEDGCIVVGKTLAAGRLNADNEHIADAMAAIKAGIATPAFKQLIALLGNHETARPLGNRPAPGKRNRVRL